MVRLNKSPGPTLRVAPKCPHTFRPEGLYNILCISFTEGMAYIIMEHSPISNHKNAKHGANHLNTMMVMKYVVHNPKPSKNLEI